MELSMLQNYWWLLISVLGAILVFLLFVQGGQTMLLQDSDTGRELMASSLGHKWELTFTTLVTFGGAFFASFPLFYSTSFGGAYWLWVLILFSFILQAVSYQFRNRPGNIFGRGTYDVFLLINGAVGCILLGVAVGMFYTPSPFTVKMTNILDASAPVISQWAPSRGLEAIANPFCLLLGLAVLFLARTQASLYFVNNIRGGDAFNARMHRQTLVNGIIFALLFVAWLVWLLLRDGYHTDALHTFTVQPYKYLHNYLQMWWTIPVLLIGVVMVLYAILRTGLCATFTRGIWYSGIGTVLVVLTLFWVAGYNDTAYLPAEDLVSSLTIRNSSSTHFTLTVMSWVSLLIPFVVAYIWYAWRAMDRSKTAPGHDSY